MKKTPRKTLLKQIAYNHSSSDIDTILIFLKQN